MKRKFMEVQETRIILLVFFKLIQNIILFSVKVAAILVINRQQMEKNDQNCTTATVY